MNHILATDRLVLRPVTADDHAALLAHWRSPDVRRFLFDGATLPEAEITKAIEDSIRDFAGPARPDDPVPQGGRPRNGHRSPVLPPNRRRSPALMFSAG